MKPILERVLVPMTMAESLRPVLSLAARCAWALSVPLEALFIEDEELLAFASLPFARATPLRAFETFGLDVASVIHRLDLEARRARRILESEAAAHAVNARFATVRAQPREALASARRASDLLVIGGGFSPWDRSAARELMLGNETSGLLLFGPSARPLRTITVVYGDIADDLALSLAARLAASLMATVNVIIVAQSSVLAKELQGHAVQSLEPQVAMRLSVLAPERVRLLTGDMPSQTGDLLLVAPSISLSLLEELISSNLPLRSSVLFLRGV